MQTGTPFFLFAGKTGVCGDIKLTQKELSRSIRAKADRPAREGYTLCIIWDLGVSPSTGESLYDTPENCRAVN